MPDEETTEEELQRKRFELLTAWARTTAASQKESSSARLTVWRERFPPVDATVLVFQRDRSVAGTVLGSAVAFRLFLFFVPVVLVAVGIAGFVGQIFDRREVVETSGLTGMLADQVTTALSDNGANRWFALLIGLFGMATTGRSLTRVVQAASALAWRAELRMKVGVRLLVNVVGILVALALMAVLVNRFRQTSVPLAGLSLLGGVALYAVGWLVMSVRLPKGTNDPGAAIPGAVLVGVSLALLQAFTQWYLPAQLSSASELYGALGAAITILGWFFILGRVMVLSFVVDAVLFERFGSLSRLVFSLPVLRTVPKRFPSVSRFFDLDRADRVVEDEPRPPDAAAVGEGPDPEGSDASPSSSAPRGKPVEE
jgi:uncharacterized BrkB/YihY/UPF0761 family membrane protein